MRIYVQLWFQFTADHTDANHEQQLAKSVRNPYRCRIYSPASITGSKFALHSFRRKSVAIFEKFLDVSRHLRVLREICQGRFHEHVKICWVLTPPNLNITLWYYDDISMYNSWHQQNMFWDPPHIRISIVLKHQRLSAVDRTPSWS